MIAVLCLNMVSNTEKLMEAFIRGLPRSIEGNVSASKPQTLKEAITITQSLMDQVTKHDAEQGTNNHKQKFDDRRITTTTNNNYYYPNNRNNNNYPNDCDNNNYQNNRNNNNNNRNNDYHQQQNRRQETVKTYAATPTENKRDTHIKVVTTLGRGTHMAVSLWVVTPSISLGSDSQYLFG
ncbi:hypothetical protein Tco_0720091 [Tanacetum coccineum]